MGPVGSGEYSIVRFKTQDGSDGLNYFTVLWDFDTEEQAWARLDEMNEKGKLKPGDYIVIRTCFREDGPVSVEPRTSRRSGSDKPKKK